MPRTCSRACAGRTIPCGPTIQQRSPSPTASAGSRLAADMAQETGGLREFAASVVADGYTTAVLLGMGGSSLAPEVLYDTFGQPAGPPRPARAGRHTPGPILEPDRYAGPGQNAVHRRQQVGLHNRNHVAVPLLLGPYPGWRALYRDYRPRLRSAEAGRGARLPSRIRSTAPTSVGATRRSRTSASCPPRSSAPTSMRFLAEARRCRRPVRRHRRPRTPAPTSAPSWARPRWPAATS